MNNELTLEQLRFARDIGATHRYDDLFWKSALDVKVVAWSNIGEVWKVRDAGIDNSNSAWDEYKINFAPLDDAEQPEQQASKMHAADFLQCGINHMRDREKTYDAAGGERSMGKTVSMFNSLYGLELTEQQGLAFMCLLKIVRTSQGAFRSDNYEGLAAYAGLMGESAQDQKK